jgi:hypothetical protein
MRTSQEAFLYWQTSRDRRLIPGLLSLGPGITNLRSGFFALAIFHPACLEADG